MEEQISLDEKARLELDVRADQVMDVVIHAGITDMSFKDQLQAMQDFGAEVVGRSAQVTRRVTHRPAKADLDATHIGQALQRLKEQVHGLDPDRQKDLLAQRKLFGFIPIGNGVAKFFGLYRTSQLAMNVALQALYTGQDSLRKKNATLAQDKQHFQEGFEHFAQYIHLGKLLLDRVEKILPSIEQKDPQRSRILRDEFQFMLSQRVQELQIQLQISQQGWMAMEMISRNNLELIKGIDRAVSTTVSALRIAVKVARSLTDQHFSLDQMPELMNDAEDLIGEVANDLHAGSVKLHVNEKAAELKHLVSAFNQLYLVIDEVDAQQRQTSKEMPPFIS